MDLGRIYKYRFKNTDSSEKARVWRPIAHYIYDLLGNPGVILDAAGGSGEFITAVPSRERWMVDSCAEPNQFERFNVKALRANLLDVNLPENYFEAVFVSNLLEHFESQKTVAKFLERISGCLRPGGRLAIMGPNFKYCAKDYFDCSDHSLALTHISVAEHLYGAGFQIERVISKFLPFSFRSRLPANPWLTKLYLHSPWAWPVLGKQFLVLGTKP